MQYTSPHCNNLKMGTGGQSICPRISGTNALTPLSLSRLEIVLLQDLSPEKFLSSVRDIHQYILSGEIAHELIKSLHRVDLLRKLILKEGLSKRKIEVSISELDILYLIFLKKNNQEIA